MPSLATPVSNSIASETEQAISWRGPMIATCLFLAITFGGSPNFRIESGPNASPYAGDFLQEWLGGYVVRHGDYAKFYNVEYVQQLQHDPSLIGFEWDRNQYLPLVYPPFYYLLVSPLSSLSVKTAAWVWVALMTACYLATLLLVARANQQTESCWFGWANAWRPTNVSTQASVKSLGPWLLPLSAMFNPLIQGLVSSQKGTLLLLLFFGTFRLLETKRPFVAGLLFGCVAFKPQFALPIAIAMLWKRQWRFVAGGLVTGMVFVALSLSMGWDVCRQYVEFARGTTSYIQTAGYDLSRSHCLYGFFSLLLGDREDNLIRYCMWFSSFAIVTMLARVLRGPLDTSQPEFALQFSAMTIATLLLSPHLYTYDLTLLLLPCCLLLLPRIRTLFGDRHFSWQKSVVVAMLFVGDWSSVLAKKTSFQISTLLMIVLILSLLLRTVRNQVAVTGRVCQATS